MFAQAEKRTLVAEEKLAPWSKIGIHLFMLSGKNDVLILDYYSHFLEIVLLEDTKAKQACISNLFSPNIVYLT